METKRISKANFNELELKLLGNNTFLISDIRVNGTDSFVAALDAKQPSVSGSEGEFSSPSTSLANFHSSTPQSLDNRKTPGTKKRKTASKEDEEQQLITEYLKDHKKESLLRKKTLGLEIKKLELEVWLLEAKKSKLEKEMNND